MSHRNLFRKSDHIWVDRSTKSPQPIPGMLARSLCPRLRAVSTCQCLLFRPSTVLSWHSAASLTTHPAQSSAAPAGRVGARAVQPHAQATEEDQLDQEDDDSADESQPQGTTLSNLRPEEWMKIKPNLEDLLEIGVFGVPHGIRGNIKLKHSIEEGRDWCRRRGPRWLLPGEVSEDTVPQPVHIGGCKITRNKGKRLFIARVMTCKTQEEAQAFRNLRLMMLREEFEGEQDDDDEDSYPAEDLIGLQVHMLLHPEGQPELIGHVISIHEGMGSHDNLMIQLKDKDTGFMLPFAEALVPDVDFEAARILITPPAGLLDIAIPLTRSREAPL